RHPFNAFFVIAILERRPKCTDTSRPTSSRVRSIDCNSVLHRLLPNPWSKSNAKSQIRLRLLHPCCKTRRDPPNSALHPTENRNELARSLLRATPDSNGRPSASEADALST